MRRIWAVVLGLGVIVGAGAGGDDDASAQIPTPFAPFEHMIGAWKGTGVPRVNRIKGWEEQHLWAWKFQKGVPVGMALELKGDKAITQGALSYDEVTAKYRLEGKDAADKPVAYVGAMDKTGKALVLERVGANAEGKERITIRPNANKIRYQLMIDRQEAGAPQYKNAIEVGLTKEGESFAAGGSASDLPKCVVTGGSSTMSITFDGKSYPICCSGCRDEFNDNPTKYVKKALLRSSSPSATVKPASGGGKGDGEFDGLVDEPKAMPKSKSGRPSSKKAADSPSSDSSPAPKPAADPAAKAAGLLSQAQDTEKKGNTTAAVIFYKRLVKDYPTSTQAKTATARLKALGEK